MTGPNTALLVITNTAIRRMLASGLERRGYRAIEAADPLDAMHSVAHHGAPGLLVVDAKLGRRKGARLIQRFAGYPATQHVPSILLVDPAQEAEGQRGLQGVDNATVLLKAASLDAMLDALEEANNKLLERAGPATAHGDLKQIARDAAAEFEGLDQALAAFEAITNRLMEGEPPGPILPPVLEQAIELAANPQANFSMASDLLSQHDALAKRLMKIANNPMYAGRAPPRTLDQAIGRIGLEGTFALVPALAVLDYAAVKDTDARTLITDALRRAYLTALVAEQLTQITSAGDMQQAHALGLFHNLGATYYLHAYALLREAGELGAVDGTALGTLAASRLVQLNETVADVADLPQGVGYLLWQLEPRGIDLATTVRHVRHGIWVAGKVIDEEKQRVIHNAEAELVQLDAEVLRELNDKLPELTGTVAHYEP